MKSLVHLPGKRLIIDCGRVMNSSTERPRHEKKLELYANASAAKSAVACPLQEARHFPFDYAQELGRAGWFRFRFRFRMSLHSFLSLVGGGWVGN